MPKLLLLIITFLTCFTLLAQRPGSFYNTHVYTAKEGIMHANFSLMSILKEGQLVANSYSNGQYFIGNTETEFVSFSGKEALQNAQFFIIGRDSFLINPQPPTLVHFSKKELRPLINSPSETKSPLCVQDYGIIYTGKRNGKWRLENFDGKKCTPSGPVGFAEMLVSKNNRSGEFFIVTVSDTEIFIFSLDTLTLKCVARQSFPLLAEQMKKRLNAAYITGNDSLIVGFDNQFYQITPTGNKRVFVNFRNVSGHNHGITFFDGIHASGLLQFGLHGPEVIKVNTLDRLMDFVNDDYHNSIYVGGYNKLYRSFRHIKQYPSVFNNSNSSAIMSLQQSADGVVWAGSYNGVISKIFTNKIETIPSWNKPVLPGGASINNDVYFITEAGPKGEDQQGIYRLMQGKQIRQISKRWPGFYLFQSDLNTKIYYGTAGKGLWITDNSSFQKGIPTWEVVDTFKGMHLANIVTITEDQQGRIWMGRPSQGISIYYPRQQKAETFLIEKKQVRFGAMSSLTDSYGTVWLGTNKGLWYYNKKGQRPIVPQDIFHLNHPLLDNDKVISSLKQWGDWLIIGAEDKIVLLNLARWMTTGKVVMRYLNPQEANFTGSTEQNAMLIDRRDSSIWFSTSDMLYQWDIKKWLGLPVFQIQPAVRLQLSDKVVPLRNGENVTTKPTENTLSLTVGYQSKDNMPRYVSMALFGTGDQVTLPVPSLQNTCHYPNLRSGKYKLVMQIFEQDGTTSIYQYPITIDRFLWQNWWFWALIAACVIAIAIYFVNIERKRQLAEERAKRITAEAEALKSEQNRQLTKMQVVSLSNQFRPHFILNALNTIGAQLNDKPQVDAVLGQLGDSIGIMFKNAQAGRIAHPLSAEWKLVESVINIKQMEFRNEVKINLTGTTGTLTNSELMVPMGMLQIPVENALIHGLRNKESGNREIWIDTSDQGDELEISITDNGIGRRAAANISNYRKNGVGIKNLTAIIDMLNNFNRRPIHFCIQDDVFGNEGEKYGTRVILQIPKIFSYEIG